MPGSYSWLRPAAFGILILGLGVRVVAIVTLGRAFSANVATRAGQRSRATMVRRSPSKLQAVPEFGYHKGVSKASSYLPAGFHTLSVHLTMNGAADNIEFLKRAFDAVELTRSPSPDGRLLNASVRIGDSVMMLNDVFPEFGAKPNVPGGWPLRLTLYLPDADAAWAKALAAGCKVVFPIRDQFWGDRYGEVEDPLGFVWAIATHLEDLTAAEIEARRQKAFGGGPPLKPESVMKKRPTSQVWVDPEVPHPVSGS